MTRYRISTVLVGLIIGMFVAVNTPAVSADTYCEMGAYEQCGQRATSDIPVLSLIPLAVSTEDGCDAADASTVDQCVAMAAAETQFFVTTPSAARSVEDLFEGCVAVTQDEEGCNAWAIANRTLHVASTGPAVAVSNSAAQRDANSATANSDYRFVELNTITLPTATIPLSA